jgi:hypothetical protein
MGYEQGLAKEEAIQFPLNLAGANRGTYLKQVF